MDQMMLQLRQGVPGSSTSPEEKLKTCNYVIMGEERLVSEASGLRGYRLHGLDKVATVGTVGRVWRLADVEVEEGDVRPLLKSNPSLKRLCPSMALTDHYRDLILQGLFKEDEDGGSLVFEVLNNEVDFLSEYYHSVYPVVLASPYFFVVNYLVVPVVVCCLCATTTVLSGSGHVLFAFHAIKADKYAIRYGVLRLLRCLLERALTIPQAFFPAIDVIISYLLFTAFFLEQLIEFVNRWRHKSVFPRAIRFISWARRRLRPPSNITIKQFSVMSSFWHPATLPSASLPREAKPSMVKRFRLPTYGYDHVDDNTLAPIPLSKGRRALEMPGRLQYTHLSWFCNIECVAEAILTWHIATSLLEMKHPQRKRNGRPDVVVMRLSNYCTYLMGSCPELNMKNDLRKELGFWGYHFSSKHARYNKIMMLTHDKLRPPDRRDESMTVVQEGIVLGKALIEASSKGSDQPVWELLADVWPCGWRWSSSRAYVAPSSGDQHVKGHEEALARGSEVMTLLWALATHTGITRPPPTAVAVEMIDDGVCPA
ncbi:hypothetical protein VPH35_134441 [Triticum aestivum]